VSTVRFDPPVYLVPPQWIVLAVTPVLTLAAGVWLVARFERKAASGALLRYPAG
jgi:cytochrome c-type biogenesis protein CcmH/NrfF